MVSLAEIDGYVDGGSDGIFLFDNSGTDLGTIYLDANGGSSVDAIAFAQDQRQQPAGVRFPHRLGRRRPHSTTGQKLELSAMWRTVSAYLGGYSLLALGAVPAVVAT